MTDLTIIGVLGIFDPPRPETAHTVATCRRAVIRFFMMTGDFGLTGAAIARQIGLYSSERDPDTFATTKSRRDASADEHAGHVRPSQAFFIGGDDEGRVLAQDGNAEGEGS